MAKQPVSVELYYDGAWRAATPRDQAAIVVKRGLADEAGGVVPQSATLTLDARTEPYNPYNPASALYGLAGRGTPIRVSLTPGRDDAADTFTRTVSGGWNAAETGQAWALTGSGGAVAASDWDVTGSAGTTYVPIATGIRVAYLNGTDIADCTQAITFACAQATGASLNAGLLFRYTGTEFILVRAILTTANAVQLLIRAADLTDLATVTTSLTHAGAGTPLRLKARVAGRDIWAKIWAASSTEPDDWDLHVTDTTTVPTTGAVGIQSRRDIGNTNSTDPQFSYDNYAVTVSVPRFVGEVSSWKPARAIKGDAWTDVEAGGVLRRLSRRASPLRSALYGFLSQASGGVAYWPLEEAGTPDGLGEVRGGGRPGRVEGAAATFGGAAGDLIGAEAIVTVPVGSYLVLPVTGSPSTTGWSTQFMMRYPTAPAATSSVAYVSTRGSVANWYFETSATGWNIKALDADGATLDSAGSTWGTGAEPPTWLIVRLNVTQTGGNIDWDLTWSPVGTNTAYTTGTQTFAATVGDPTQIVIRALVTEFEAGHVYLEDYQATNIYESAYRATGYAGETAADRMTRLCAAAGVTFQLDGSAADTPPMGGQRVNTLVNLLTECAVADGGILHEPRGWLGIRYRTLRSLYNQTPALTLDMTAGHIMPTLAPVVDSLDATNDVTARRPRGSEARAELTTGRMSVQDPPIGAGRTATETEVVLYDDGRLPGWAQWALHLGTVDEARYPQVTVNADASSALAAAVDALEIGDVIAIDNLDNLGTVRMLALGYAENYGGRQRLVTFNCAPASPYCVGQLDHTTYGLLGSDGSTLAAPFVAGTHTTMSVAVAAGHPLWTTGSVALQVRVGGNVVTVTAIAGGSSPQTFTVSTTLVSGVAKTIAAGEAVDLATPIYIGL